MEAKNRSVDLKGGVTKQIIKNITGIREPGFHVRRYFREFGYSIGIWLEKNWYSGLSPAEYSTFFPNMILQNSKIWDTILINKQKFYTKNLKSFIDYARRQASKYGIKGSRINAALQVLKILKDEDPSKSGSLHL